MSVDFGEVSEFEREELRKIASNECHPEREYSLADYIGFGHHICCFFLTLDGVKPMYEFTVISHRDTLHPNEWPFIDVCGTLPIKAAKRIRHEYKRDGTPSMRLDWEVYASDDARWLAEVERDDDETLGEYFGYPEECVEAFVNDETASDEWLRSVFSVDDLRYLEFLPFKVPESERGAMNAIELGKEWDERVRELAAEYEYLSGLEWWADWTLKQGEQRFR